MGSWHHASLAIIDQQILFEQSSLALHRKGNLKRSKRVCVSCIIIFVDCLTRSSCVKLSTSNLSENENIDSGGLPV